MLDKKLLKPYKPQGAEERIYKLWEDAGFFNPDICIEKGICSKNAERFSIVLPPPNVTGTLHMGSAAMLAIEDIIVRYNRMQGKKTLWLPGTDHAAIATESKVAGMLFRKEKKTRRDLGRKEFLKRVEQFAGASHDTIINQIKALGASVDWSREAFTLDEKRSFAVRTAFKNMYNAGLIYRGARIVNWDPKLQTTVSDDEVERREERTPFYYLKYGPFTIGTARPETKFGDKYVVMHPDDKRYKKYKHGQKIELEWIGGPITATVIKDTAIDMEFGTGVMTITPWHDANDFDIAERHGLDKEQIIDLNGKLLPIADELAGMHIRKARPLIVEKLRSKGLLEKVDENYVHNLAINTRGEGIIEPQIMEQWFININAKFKIKNSKLKGVKNGQEVTLKEIMRKVIASGQIEIIPSRFKKIYFHWIDNLRDWCISRQIWYGHQIPVWYCNAKRESISKQRCNEPIVSIEDVKICPHCGGNVEQDPDTLDTWFSSALWTFSTLGWPEETADLKTYHPTSILETGYDILFFWVARMILMSGYHLGDIPFEKVYLHGLVRDEKGRKMSKSLDNIIDPLVVIEKYGADATRLSLIIGNPPGQDLKLSEDKIRGYKHFTNKVWNVARFVLSNVEGLNLNKKPILTKKDNELLRDLQKITKEITNDIGKYRLYLAGEKLYHYLWHTFADKILEDSKPILNGKNKKEKESKQWILLEILSTNLKMLHPFMPFVTEEIWQMIPAGTTLSKKKSGLLVVEQWPV